MQKRIEILISKLILTFLKYLEAVPNYFEESWSSDFLKFSSKFRHVKFGMLLLNSAVMNTSMNSVLRKML